MEILEKYDNRTVAIDDRGMLKYLVEPYAYTDSEKKLLENCEKLFTQGELETVRKEPDISLRKKSLQEYLKTKIQESKNRESLIEEIINRVIGYGGLSPLMKDQNLEEVMINGVNLPVFVFHRRYGMCSTNVIFKDKNDIFKIINRICWIHGKELAPVIDMTALDGSRINVTSEPITLHGPTMTIRKQKKNPLTITELLKNGTLDVDLAALLWLSADGMRMCPSSIVVSGMIGSGKTTLLNALIMLTPPEDRIVTIEETPELQLSGRENWVPLTTQKDYDMESLVRNTLRMRPNRIVVGEIRGSEAIALFNAMNVGHRGMGTMHSSSAREVISRLENPPMNVPTGVITNLDLIVVMNIMNYHGRPVRRVTEVAEVGGREGDKVLLGEIYRWDPKRDKAVEDSETAPTAYLDKLADKLKVTKRSVMDELARRRAVLTGMVNEDILEYKEVFAAITEFYKNQSARMEAAAAREIAGRK